MKVVKIVVVIISSFQFMISARSCMVRSCRQARSPITVGSIIAFLTTEFLVVFVREGSDRLSIGLVG